MGDGDADRGSPALPGWFPDLQRDTDGDGLTDTVEAALGTDPRRADTDGDKLADAFESKSGLDPTNADSDRDGLADGLELEYGSNPLVRDSDGDGRTDGQERELGTDPVTSDRAPRPYLGDGTDTDQDRVDDWTELVMGTDPNKPDDWADTYDRISDSDRDGLTDRVERQIGTSPHNRDTDKDGLDDLFELQHGLDPKEGLDDAPDTPAPTPMRLPEQPAPTRPVELTQVRDDAKIEDFLGNVLAQIGDTYKRGAEASLRDDDPDQWDGSELVEWAANRAGVMINDGAANQYKQIVRHDGDISVDDALRTPGALLYEFTGDPVSGTPTRASTAISLGDGRIIDIDPAAGVRIMDAKDFRFTHAGVMHGFTDARAPGQGALDVVNDALVQHGIEVAAPAPAPSAPSRQVPTVPDTPEIAALADRAADLRGRYMEAATGTDRIERVDRAQDVAKEVIGVKDTMEWTRRQIADELQNATESGTKADELTQQAAEAEAAGRLRDAEELREDAAEHRALADTYEKLAARNVADLDKLQLKHDELQAQHDALERQDAALDRQRDEAEHTIDAMEDRVRYLRESNAQSALATDLDREAAELRAQGNVVEADARAQEAAAAHAAAAAAQANADAQVVDETKLAPLQSSAFDVDDAPADSIAAAPPDLDAPAGDLGVADDFADDVVSADSLAVSVGAIDDAADDLTVASVPDIDPPSIDAPSIDPVVVPTAAPVETVAFEEPPASSEEPALDTFAAPEEEFADDGFASPVVDESVAPEQDPIDPSALA